MVDKPDVAVVTNIESTHLDHHISLDEYVDAKEIFLFIEQQSENDFKMLIVIIQSAAEYTMICGLMFEVSSVNFLFGIRLKRRYMKENGDIVYNDNGTETLVMNKNDIVIPGMHNVENYCTAITAVWGMVARNNKKDCTVDFWRCWSIN